MASGVERFLLYNPGSELYHCGGFLDPERARAYLYHSLQFAKQGLMRSLVDVGDRKQWVILRAQVDWDEFGDLIQCEIQEQIKTGGAE
jgi:hypothetical protein